MAKQRVIRALREWTEDCRVAAHQDCQHIGSASTIGLLGARTFVTVCPCACHWGCPAETARLTESNRVCTCSTNGDQRRQNFEALAQHPASRRIADRHR